MTDYTIPEDVWREYCAMLDDEYARQIAAGRPATPAKAAAKAAVNAAYPEIAALLTAAIQEPHMPQGRAGHALTVRLNRLWRDIARRAGKSRPAALPLPPVASAKCVPLVLPTPPTPPTVADNGDRAKPGIVLYSSGYSNVAATVLAMVRAVAPQPGDLLHLGNLAALNFLIGCSRWAIPNVVLNQANNTTMRDAGYEFVALGRGDAGYTGGCYIVRCVAAPQSAAAREADELRGELAAMAAKQKELEARLRGLAL